MFEAHSKRRRPFAGVVVTALLIMATSSALATRKGDSDASMARVWNRFDQPVASGAVRRTWTWGPDALGDIVSEQTLEYGDRELAVQYYEKGRIDLRPDNGGAGSPDSFRSGMLVRELLTGNASGESESTARNAPATANVAGDANQSDAVSYATLASVPRLVSNGPGEPIDMMLDPAGTVGEDPSLMSYGVVAVDSVELPDRPVASIFLEFLTSPGLIWTEVGLAEGPLIPDLQGTVGAPITDPYWIRAVVSGVEQDVLIQCFERRCLTYTPGNPEGWQVEWNNAGAHYLEWRETATHDDSGTYQLPSATITNAAGVVTSIELEVAATSDTRRCGLMHRTDMPEDTGMLFVFASDSIGGFWNCNTFIPLTLAWIDDQGAILGLTDMAPQTPGTPQQTVTFPAPGPYRYVIEANQGWFSAHGIAAGDQVDLRDALEAGDTGTAIACQELGFACN